MKYSNTCGADFFPRPAKGYATRVKTTCASIPKNGKFDVKEPIVPKGQQHQNWALVNTSTQFTMPTRTEVVRISMLQLKQAQKPADAVKVAQGKPVKSESRKRIEKMRAQYQKKLSLHNQFVGQ
jgi:glutamine synthetase